MKTHDELQALTDSEKLEYLKNEVEKIINSAPPHQVLKLRALQARMDGIRNRVRNPIVSMNMIADEMMRSFLELNEALKPLRKDL